MRKYKLSTESQRWRWYWDVKHKEERLDQNMRAIYKYYDWKFNQEKIDITILHSGDKLITMTNSETGERDTKFCPALR